jgi:hypothetical protein
MNIMALYYQSHSMNIDTEAAVFAAVDDTVIAVDNGNNGV